MATLADRAVVLVDHGYDWTLLHPLLNLDSAAQAVAAERGVEPEEAESASLSRRVLELQTRGVEPTLIAALLNVDLADVAALAAEPEEFEPAGNNLLPEARALELFNHAVDLPVIAALLNITSAEALALISAAAALKPPEPNWLNHSLGRMAYAHKHLYFAAETGIGRVNVNGRGYDENWLPNVLSPGSAGVEHIHATDKYIVWYEQHQDEEEEWHGTWWKAHINGTHVEEIFSQDNQFTGRAGVTDDTYLYFRDEQLGGAKKETIGRVNLDGTDLKKEWVVLTDTWVGKSIAISGEYLYFDVGQQIRTIARMKTDGTDLKEEWRFLGEELVTPIAPHGLAVGPSHIYWLNSNFLFIERVALSGAEGARKPEAFIRQPETISLATDAHYLYWGHFPGYTGRALLTLEVPEEDDYAETIREENNLIGYWRLNDPDTDAAEEAEGTVPVREAVDSSGFDNDGTYKALGEGTYARQAGKLLTADTASDSVNLSGGGHVELPLNILQPTSELSVECWLKYTAASEGVHMVFDNLNWPDGTYGWFMAINTAIGATSFEAHDNEVNSGVATGIGVIEANKVFHVVWTYNAGVTRCYINGEEIPQEDLGGSNAEKISYAPDVPNPPRIGAEAGQEPEVAFNFEGQLSEVAVYARALTAQQVTEHYEAGV